MIGPMPSELEPGDHAEPDRAATDDQRHIAGLGIARAGMLQAHREGFDHRGQIVVEFVGNLQQMLLVEQHVFAEAAGKLIDIADDLEMPSLPA